MRTPRMITLLTPEFKETLLNPLLNLPLLAIPHPSVVDRKNFRKMFKRCPLHRDGHQLLPALDRRHKLVWQVAIDIILDFLNCWASPHRLLIILRTNRGLEPISNLKDIPQLQLIVLLQLHGFHFRQLLNLFFIQGLPLQDLLVAQETMGCCLTVQARH